MFFGRFHRNSGFKLALIHHLDMPLMGQTAINVSPGTDVQIAVTPTIIGISKDAESRFDPDERECYMPEELSLPHLLPTDFRYQV